MSSDPVREGEAAVSKSPTASDAAAQRVFWGAFVLASAASILPLWLVRWIPMVDLPQHASQVATWHRWVDGTFAFGGLWEVNYTTPYLLSRVLAFLLAHVVSVLDAYRILVSISVLFLPLAALVLLRRSGGSPWWALLLFPLGYGYSFDWGFVAYSLAAPLGLLHLALAWRQSQEFTWQRAFGLWMLTQALFFAHVFVFGWAGLVAAAVLGLRARSAAGLLRAWAPLVAALPLPVLWIVSITRGDPTVLDWTYLDGGLFRFPQMLTLLTGAENPTLLSVAVGGALYAAPLFLGGRPSRDRVRWAPLLITTILVLGAPLSAFGTGFIYPRMAVYLLPSWLFALVPIRRPRFHPAWLLVLIVVLALGVGARLRGFDREVGDFDRIVEAVQPNSRVLYFALDRDSRFSDNAVYLHFGQWIQVEQGGIVDFSFAEFFPNLFRYRRGASPPLPTAFEWRFWEFDYHLHGGELYDYFLVRSPNDPTSRLFADLADEVELVRRADGGWWLYGRRSALSPDGRSTATDRGGEAPGLRVAGGLRVGVDVILGGQPTLEELEAAAADGVETVLTLRPEAETVPFDEAAAVERLGMAFVRLPIASAADIHVESARALVALLDTAATPVLLHCGSSNRVGALLALDAALERDLDVEEALEVGRVTGLSSLEPVVRERLEALSRDLPSAAPLDTDADDAAFSP